MSKPMFLALHLTALLLVPGPGIPASPQDYFLGLSGPSLWRQPVGTVVRQKYSATLQRTGPGEVAPVEGWSLAIAVRGARVLGVTVAGTAGAPALSGGSAESEIVDLPGGQGILSRVRLPEPTTVSPIGAPTLILTFELEAMIPPQDRLRESTISLELAATGLAGLSGVVVNSLRTADRELEPRLGPALAVPLVADSICQVQEHLLLLGFSSRNVSSPIPFDGIVGDETRQGEIEVPGEGEKTSLRVFACAISLLDDLAAVNLEEPPGIQGFSLSIGIAGDLECAGATMSGTAWDMRRGGNSGGFNKSECIDPRQNGGQQGVVGAIVLSFVDTAPLPPIGTYSLLEISLETSGPPGPAPRIGSLRFEDGRRGSGQPVQNALTVYGATVLPCNLEQTELTIHVRQPTFRRGDANFDHKLDVSDPVTLLRSQFLGDAQVYCEDAGDANDDGELDIADAIFTFGYLFLGAREPPPPFPAAGVDPTVDGLGCSGQPS